MNLTLCEKKVALVDAHSVRGYERSVWAFAYIM
jgi:hypothetical protein